MGRGFKPSDYNDDRKAGGPRVSVLNKTVLVAALYLFCNYLLGIFLHFSPENSFFFLYFESHIFSNPMFFSFLVYFVIAVELVSFTQ